MPQRSGRKKFPTVSRKLSATKHDYDECYNKYNMTVGESIRNFFPIFIVFVTYSYDRNSDCDVNTYISFILIFYFIYFLGEMFKTYQILNDIYKVPENEEKVRKHGCVSHCVLEKIGAVGYLLFIYINYIVYFILIIVNV